MNLAKVLSKKLNFALSKVLGNEVLVNYYRKCGLKIGENTHIYSDILTSEPYLIEIGENSTISTNVKLITHDSAIGAIGNRNNASDLCGRILIGNNCFIGNNAIILYGVTIADKVIVGAGSVVTKSIKESNVIVAGNPAKIISSIDEYVKKNNDNFLSLHGMNDKEKEIAIINSGKLIER